MGSRFDDELWELVPDEPEPPPRHLAEFVRSLGPAERALDVGCGDGRLTVELRAAALVAADVSTVALARARRALPAASLVELEPDARLPLDDAAFDLALCAETIEHVRDTQLFVSELRRVLSPGGTLALSTPAHGRADALRLAARGFELAFDPLGPHLRFYTRRSLAALLERMGFEPVALQTVRGSLLARASR